MKQLAAGFKTVCRVQFAVVLLMLCACSQGLNAQDIQQERDQVWIHTATNEALLFNVEMAVTSSQKAQGLMNRTYLPPNAGMLFVFNDEDKRSFWMKDTLIPLDMLFLAKDGTIHHIHHMARPQSEAHITSERPSMAVLEINGGYSDALGIKEGDKVLHPVFRNTLAQ